jgi:hypothetical protein
MGYNVSTTETNWTIPADKVEDAYKAVCALNHDPNARKGGGSWGGGQRIEVWFSWMSANYDTECKDLCEVMEMVGFDCGLEEDGTFYLGWYDSKTGDEDQFLAALAPFSTEGSYLVWQGEDGALWRNEVVGGQMVTKQAKIEWVE